MTTTTIERNESTTGAPAARGVDLKLEVSVLPVADIDRAKSFYGGLGWRLDADFIRPDGSRAVQFTPPGSPTSIHFGSAPANFLVVNDIAAARAELTARGAEVSAIFHPGYGPGGRASRSSAAQRPYTRVARQRAAPFAEKWSAAWRRSASQAA